MHEIGTALNLTTEQVLEAMEAASAYDAVSLESYRFGDEGDGETYAESIGVEDDRFELVRTQTAALKAEAHRLLGQLPRREGHGRLAVLAAREALLLGGGHRLPVDDEGGGGIVEDGVDAED